MITLSIDTSEHYCSAAIVNHEECLAKYSENIGRGHAEKLLPTIKTLLTESNLEWADLKKIAVIVGPGTFTGLRIGLSVARGLALSLKIPCIGVSGLECLAAQIPAYGTIHTCIAGRGETSYYQKFEKTEGGSLTATSEAASLKNSDIVEKISETTKTHIIGSGASHIKKLTNIDQHTFIEQSCDTETLGYMAQSLSSTSNPANPHYLRAPDAVKAKPVFNFQTK
ncbi:tRNA (adenosine(37)-N6)-threonylcarbamoyltransferase complex dimerization subunit type 1 TsaB [Kordiimonas sp. SCSIO 12610]|uniref:tRNA (adenosine(37)-N6)-threonylcarbamoyltransferase complex dimerization subunit type 1 TsaB n=1 Tax=Kordiimonas sp. SCSIO 12610 TaxID=2829597 RepID=UPI00210A6041|nr:tRNA (adenosine(37)-N6)-threonylcarbamoyltransferase complex dimerization subunit type 1 TsaB [Kordiimonas sp. SCSIO 12610]UTW55086.1 tRNA (adenosine(37)-N6)-threonylcarbamoyltransferase complex dimerization subunit type 1 TsaB [Kordiimonas sp. SCSIO 12610]